MMMMLQNGFLARWIENKIANIWETANIDIDWKL